MDIRCVSLKKLHPVTLGNHWSIAAQCAKDPSRAQLADNASQSRKDVNADLKVTLFTPETPMKIDPIIVTSTEALNFITSCTANICHTVNRLVI